LSSNLSHRAHFTPLRIERKMPVVLSFLLIGFFIWIAENIGTFFGAWVYPNQAQQWAIVGPAKISSWMLLVIISFIIVAALKEIFPTKGMPPSVEEEGGRSETVAAD
jgi:uncharacterized membrane protein YoaT (DUF817 family)